MSTSIQPRKQRKAWYSTPAHKRRKQMASHLSEELLLRYNVRRTPVVSGDEVKVLRGDKRGESGKVVDIDTKHRQVIVEGVTHKKADGTDVAMPIDASNLVIVRLNLEDKRRRAKLSGEHAPSEPAPAKKAKPAKPAKEAAPAKEAKPAKEAAPEAKAAEPARAAAATAGEPAATKPADEPTGSAPAESGSEEESE